MPLYIISSLLASAIIMVTPWREIGPFLIPMALTASPIVGHKIAQIRAEWKEKESGK